MKKLLLGLVLAGMGTMALPALASATPSSGTEHFHIVTTNSEPGYVLATGLFTASGISYDNSNVGQFVFSNGTFLAHHPQKEAGPPTYTVNPNTCAVKVVVHGPFTLSNGFGAYEGIKGSGTYTVTISGVLPRKANGTCNGNGTPYSTVQVVNATGTVSFS